jgi:hypothetical protein
LKHLGSINTEPPTEDVPDIRLIPRLIPRSPCSLQSIDPNDDNPPDDESQSSSRPVHSESKTMSVNSRHSTELARGSISLCTDAVSKRRLEDGYPRQDGRKRQRVEDDYGLNFTAFQVTGNDSLGYNCSGLFTLHSTLIDRLTLGYWIWHRAL